MHKSKFIMSLVLVASILFVQVGGAFAAPALQTSTPATGLIQSITLETDSTTGVTIAIVDLIDDNQVLQSLRVSQETAIDLGLVVLNSDGKPGINNLALGRPVEIDLADVIPTEEENQHPVGSALAIFFSDVPGIDYESIMTAHEQGTGFAVIAQTLWLTTKLEGNSEVFKSLLKAKQTGNYSAFILEDGSTPKNWGQLKKAILEGEKNGSNGVTMSEMNDLGTDNNKENDKEKDKDKDNNGNNKEKDKNKEKEKDKNK